MAETGARLLVAGVGRVPSVLLRGIHVDFSIAICQKMVKSCCAIGGSYRFVKSSEGGKPLYRFPADPERKKRWVIAVKRSDLQSRLGKLWEPGQYDYLCSKHFVGGK